MTYKKLFNIHYQNKRFTIFIDENNRRTFLEINNKGEYVYPKLEDFLVLNEIYNNRNPFIQNTVRKYTFREKVLATISGGLIVLDLVFAGVLMGEKTSIEISNGKVTINTLNKTQGGSSNIQVKDVKELDKILGYKSVSASEVQEAINNNENLDQECKEIANNLIEELTKEYPEVDLRIFYERIKTFKANKMELEEIQEKYKQPGIGGNNSATNNQMNIPYDATRSVIAHEIAHCLNNFSLDINGVHVTKYTSRGYSLDEAMNSDIASLVEDDQSYSRERSVLHFLQSCVPHEIDTHLNKGIWYLIEELKSCYPNSDIDFIIDNLDSMTDTSANFGMYIPLDANINFLDELFDMCKENVSKNSSNIYEPFIKFSKMFTYTETEDIYFTYLDKYNEHLKSLGYSDVITKEDIESKLAVYTDSYFFYIYNGKVYPLLDKKDSNGLITGSYIITEDGIEELGLTFLGETSKYFRFDDLHVMESFIENQDIFGTSEYWKKIGLENNVIMPYQLGPINITLNDKDYKRAFIPDMLISFGRDKNGNIAFRLTEGDNNIYESAPVITDCSCEFGFATYVGDFTDEELELTDYLNTDYMKNWMIKSTSTHNIENIYIEDDEIKIYPIYRFTVKDGDKVYDFSVDEHFYNINYKLFPKSSLLIYDDLDVTYREVFNYFNILDESKKTYEFTITELEEIVLKYVEEKTRDMPRR